MLFAATGQGKGDKIKGKGGRVEISDEKGLVVLHIAKYALQDEIRQRGESAVSFLFFFFFLSFYDVRS